MSQSRELTIERRFNGPPRSGNGGWVAGCLAERLRASIVEVSLRAPPPLDIPLQVRAADEGIGLYEADRLLASARALVPVQDASAPSHATGDRGWAVPSAPTYDAAAEAGRWASTRAAARVGSPYLYCFACGVARGDGLRLQPGPVGADGLVATVWTPAADSVGEIPGHVSLPTLWAALDCPAGIAWSHRLTGDPVMMTARMTTHVLGRPRIGEPCIVTGWPIERDGRKLWAGTAVFDRQGRLYATSRQLWLLPREAG